jgi:transcriptional regulator with XRE-family HTH domain
MQELKDRIAFLVREKGLSINVIAFECDVDPAVFSRLKNGEQKTVQKKNLKLIADYFNVDPYWLQTGKGEMRKTQNQYTNCEPGSPEFQNQLNELKLQNRILQERLDECRKLIYYMNNKDGPQKKYVAGDSVENRSTGSG